MNTVLKRISYSIFLFLLFACNAPGGNENSRILIKTSAGDIKIDLYDNTPIHRDNFIKLVEMGFYDGISFHRVIKDFVIQAGDPATRTGLTKEQLDTLSSYTIPAEFRTEYFHKKGVIAAARQGNDVNPQMRSSGTQFYIVQGKTYAETELKDIESRINGNIKQALFSRFLKEVSDSAKNSGTPLQDSEIQEKASVKMFDYLTSKGEFKFTDIQLKEYTTHGGIPRLDGTYTVFGEVIEGLDVVDKIAGVATSPGDKPLEDVKILKIKLLNK